MLVLGQRNGGRDATVSQLPRLLQQGDCLVLNDTRVKAARLRGLVGGRAGEVLLLQELGAGEYRALVRPARVLPPGAELQGPQWQARVEAAWPGHPGGRRVRLRIRSGLDLEAVGEVPLPPYLKEPLRDRERYQTVYAQGPPVSAAAPTAGLHLTDVLLGEVQDRGVTLVRVQLEVGLATFAPIRAETVEAHPMHRERIHISELAASQIQASHRRGGRVVAVGTTAVRCLESRPDGAGGVLPGSEETALYIRPGHRFQVVQGLLTNFHQPRSSLLVMVSAFYGRARVRRAYRTALENGYHFLSFGDCMFGWAGG